MHRAPFDKCDPFDKCNADKYSDSGWDGRTKVDHFINSTDCDDASMIVEQFRGVMDDEQLLVEVEEWFGADSEIAMDVAELLDL